MTGDLFENNLGGRFWDAPDCFINSTVIIIWVFMMDIFSCFYPRNTFICITCTVDFKGVILTGQEFSKIISTASLSL